jgi:hypothetical protein
MSVQAVMLAVAVGVVALLAWGCLLSGMVR